MYLHSIYDYLTRAWSRVFVTGAGTGIITFTGALPNFDKASIAARAIFNLFLEPTYLQNENLRVRCSISRKCGNKLQKPFIYLVLGGTELF